MNSLFRSLGVDSDFAAGLAEANYKEPSKIQAQAIPALLRGQDVIGIAQTGTGKTAAFGLPLLQLIAQHVEKPAQRRAKGPLGLVLAPTRELAMQIHQELKFFAKPKNLRLTCIYGGVGQHPQVQKLARGVDILIGTPGRLLDLINQGHLSLDQVSKLVLDEADRLLDMGFIRDVKKIVSMTPRSRQSLLFSATMPREVVSLAKDILRKPARIEVAPQQVTVDKISQHMIVVDNPRKQMLLEQLLQRPEVRKAIVFARTKHGADKIARKLSKTGIVVEVLHGNKSQNARTRALTNFTTGDAWVLVATDVAARGIDIEGITHVLNYELPHVAESYVHRIGRTGRAGESGQAWSLVDPGEMKRLRAIERLIGRPLPRANEDLHEIDQRESRPRRLNR